MLTIASPSETKLVHVIIEIDIFALIYRSAFKVDIKKRKTSSLINFIITSALYERKNNYMIMGKSVSIFRELKRTALNISA